MLKNIMFSDTLVKRFFMILARFLEPKIHGFLVNFSTQDEKKSMMVKEDTILFKLGRHLFYDRRLSLNYDRSCGICHEQAKGFTDGFVRGVGTLGDIHPRNTLSLINVVTRRSLGWITQKENHGILNYAKKEQSKPLKRKKYAQSRAMSS